MFASATRQDSRLFPQYWLLVFALGISLSLAGCLSSSGDSDSTDPDDTDDAEEPDTADPDDGAQPPEIAAEGGDGKVSVEWDPVDGADTYTLYYATEGEIDPANFGTWSSDHDGVAVENPASPYTVDDLDNGTTYYFVVTAELSGDETGPSNEVSATPQETIDVAGTLNDTGIDWCSDGDHNELDCPPGVEEEFGRVEHYPGQDAEFGRDAAAREDNLSKVGEGAAGFDFTKLDEDGDDLPADADAWSCVRDNHTGLIWEVKTNDGGLRDAQHSYSLYASRYENNDDRFEGEKDGGDCYENSRCDTEGYVNAVNLKGLCGADDWRMPTLDELQSLVHYGRSFPAIDQDYFPNPSEHPWTYWSGTPSAQSFGGAWRLRFSDGLLFTTNKGTDLRVRLVREGE